MSTELWSGAFGTAYHERNAGAGDGRWPFWRWLYNRWPVASVLEVGCGMGANLKWAVPPVVVGVDANEPAIIAAKAAVPRGVFIHGSVARLPFPDRSYELVISVGLLIHVPPTDLPKAMDEIWRVSSKYLFVAEYDAPVETEVPYRGHRGELWKRPYSRLFSERFALMGDGRGFLGPDDGFDRLHWDMWRKRQ